MEAPLSDVTVRKDEAEPGPVAPPRPRFVEELGPWLVRHAAVAVLAVGVFAYAFYEFSAAFFAYTGDAYVAGDSVAVAPTVAGPISMLAVRDNDSVQAGDVLFRIDPRPYELTVAENEAKLVLAEANLVQANDEVSAAIDEVNQRQATLADAQVTENRYRTLRGNEFASQQQLDDATRDARIASALFLAAKARLTAARQGVVIAQAERTVAARALARARYDLGQTTVVAPAAGRVAPFLARVGDYRTVSEAVLAIVTNSNWRIVANLTERHLSRVMPGQTVWLTIGSRPWQVYTGRIRSVANGVSRTKGEVKVLPYVETTTDWIRLPRRFPVEVDLGDLPRQQPMFLGADARVLVWF
ncbi:HlyD family secretion protein [Chelatococcus reniformis]|uniref:Multidrug resistance protein MdtN n=1 Tax=Chelatococcus reniformis TaxID=1494448 RepID=A0A916XMI8_9HYPH|nr:HlyD family secretion protein [Chelatococcus reniformis]GGC84454.1 multidrug resistance protein MdtN [Chelatococcus reniformis]